MTLPIWTTNPNTPLSLGSIQTEFTGVNPIRLSEYYATPSGYVTPDRQGYPYGVETAIPLLGTPLSISNFYGASAIPYAIYPDKYIYNEGEVVVFTVTAPEPDGNVLYWTIEPVYGSTFGQANIIISPLSLPTGGLNAAYNQTITATGGIGSYTYTYTRGALPAGLTLFSGNGRIAGTPTAAGSTVFLVNVTDSELNSNVKIYTIEITNVVISLSPGTLAQGYKNVPFTRTITAAGGTSPYVFSNIGNLPDGVTLTSATDTTATLAGTTTNGTYTFTIKATDANNNFGNVTYALTINDVGVTVDPATLSSGTVNIPYSQVLTATSTNGSGPYIFTLDGGTTLPTGLTLTANTGLLGGTPTVSGTTSFTVKATDSNNNYGTRQYSLTIGSVTIALSPFTLPAAYRNVAYTPLTFTVSGSGSPPFTYSIISGSLPAGMTLTSNGVLSGTPSATGSFPVTVRAQDYYTNNGVRAYTLVVGTISIGFIPASMPAATARVDYTQAILASGGTAPYSFAITSGSLPSGFSMGPTGIITGSSNVPVVSNSFTVTVTDANGNTADKIYSLLVNAVNITITPTTLPDGVKTVAYSQALTSANGTGNPVVYTYSVTAGSLPPGLSLSSGGQLSGTPTVIGGPYSFTVTSTDANLNSGTRAYSIAVSTDQWVVDLTSYSLGSAGPAPFAADENTSLTFTITSPKTLADGVASQLRIIGPKTTDGSDVIYETIDTIRGAYTYDNGFTQEYNITGSALTLAKWIGAHLYRSNETFTGLTINTITSQTRYGLYRKPDAMGLAFWTLKAVAMGWAAASTALVSAFMEASELVGNNPSNPLLDGTRCLTSSKTFVSTGGTDFYDRADHTGNTGIATVNILADNLLEGEESFAVAVYYNNALVANWGRVVVNDTSTPPPANIYMSGVATTAQRGTIYTDQIILSGTGTSPFLFSKTGGTLPPGLTLGTADGTLYGRPTSIGVFAFTIQVRDNNNYYTQTQYTITVSAATITVSPSSLPAGTALSVYSQQLSASGGVGTYVYSLLSGSWPAGVSMSGSGLISGTIGSTAISQTPTVRVTDSYSNTGDKQYVFTVNQYSSPPPVSPPPVSPPPVTPPPPAYVPQNNLTIILTGSGQGYYDMYTDSLGRTVYYYDKSNTLRVGKFSVLGRLEATAYVANPPSEITWSIAFGSLPPGMSLVPAGYGLLSIQGTPTITTYCQYNGCSPFSAIYNPMDHWGGQGNAGVPFTLKATAANGDYGITYCAAFVYTFDGFLT